ncbi:GNAT family N-acetyltransferase [Streptomyces sp. HNM0574]|uniref:GNAT family N-acetyltransferase n=1 Tax=Streptomyces sp. HNM0574 TaxID=2714954 RepID=UPI00146C0ED4|nr:GNAT family N-acetyltransferase [Streptomyces sp. HNM0574]NLU68242.1 GNAT family N-acetyltransferase [Streptomyces sp. HNM0574]
MIRAARESDVPRLQDIERAAGKVFADIGMKAVAEDEPPSREVLLGYLNDGRSWVHADADDVAVAYILVDVIDGCAHLEQISVHPDHGRRRVGRGLVEHVADWARERGLAALTLTTFRDVVWNGPYYERCGFRWLSDAEVTSGLRELRKAEADHGLDRWPRGCMRRELSATEPADG